MLVWFCFVFESKISFRKNAVFIGVSSITVRSTCMSKLTSVSFNLTDYTFSERQVVHKEEQVYPEH